MVDARTAMILPAELDPKTAAPLFCAGVTAFHGVQDCELKPGEWIAIIGCGGLGHLVCTPIDALETHFPGRSLMMDRACNTPRRWASK